MGRREFLFRKCHAECNENGGTIVVVSVIPRVLWAVPHHRLLAELEAVGFCCVVIGCLRSFLMGRTVGSEYIWMVASQHFPIQLVI